MTMEGIGHKAISASAGSGKTFQLAHRYIELMARGVKPERIIALTFSRKAAGEIFDSIVEHLCKAAAAPEQAAQTGGLIGRPGMTQSDFLAILRELMQSLQSLRISTIDSFTVGVAQAFPMELGIPPRFQLVEDSGTASGAQQEVLARAFNRRQADPAVRRQFLRAFKQATFGREEKGLADRFDRLIGGYHGHYQVLPEPAAWGDERTIWPEGSFWLKADGDVKSAAGELEGLLRGDGLSDKMMHRWITFIEAARDFGTGSAWKREMEYLFGRLAPLADALRRGDCTVKTDGGTCHLSPQECRLALTLVAHIMKTELSVAVEKTRGIYQVLDLYERFYDSLLRRQGRLTFTDVQYLLTAGNRYSGGALLSRLPSAEARLYIDYRLDCRLDHWLLDEFQDTSDLQWEVLSNLADEILQDDSGRRSFFYVGDAKQAIYGWRGGNARLFSQVLARYREHIQLDHLATSYRSCQAVIDAVNNVFGAISADPLPAGAVAQWQSLWQVHRCEKGKVPDHGCVAVLEPPCDEGRTKPGDEDRYRAVARLLQEIDPPGRRLSAAVLVRTNKSGNELVDFLRRECGGMRIVHEGRASIKDNPVVAALLSLVKFAAHPGDTLAWRHLQMSPLGGSLAGERLSRGSLPPLLLRQIQSEGFQSLIRTWGGRLDARHPLDEFGRKRLNELINAAIEFDGTDSRDCNEFLRFIDGYEIHDLASDDAVRVMTIHQSKGLGFDVVILPDLQTGNMAAGPVDFAVARNEITGRPAWALVMPRRLVAQQDAVLKGELQAGDETTAFDALCLLYVGMTRARKGLYIITAFPGRTSTLFSPAAFVKQQLAGDPRPVSGRPVNIAGEEFTCLYETGERHWYLAAPEPAPSVAAALPAELPADFRRRPSHRRRLVHVQPSRSADIERKAGWLFAPEAKDSLDLGTAIHELFRRVSWLGEMDTDEMVRQWSKTTALTEELRGRVEGLFRRAVALPEILQALSKPRGNVWLWQEKDFETVLGNRWVSGTFDRVVTERNEAGIPLRATILDFKSDEVADGADPAALAERYRPQMVLYRDALSQILRLKPTRIQLRLVFVQPGKVIDLTA
ncbi:MAG: hypothetical protein FJ020_03315 [Chloroflexi bacterium]|nr:hypothetical protein [Chloroflexota bacterium]